MVETPVHFASPFSIGKDGAAVVEQDSPQDKTACVYRVMVCPQGYRDDLPAFGIPPVAFQGLPLDLADVEAAVALWAPRARAEVTEQVEALAEVQAFIEVS